MLCLPSATSRERLQRVDEVLAELQLSPHADQRVGAVDDARGGLSGGERRCLMLALQLLALPDLLFCDEPTSGLDARSAKQVTRRITLTLTLTLSQPSPSPSPLPSPSPSPSPPL